MRNITTEKIIFIVAITIFTLLSFFLWTGELVKNIETRIGLQMQLLALTIGIVAAVIGYLNYKRKKGDDLSVIISIDMHPTNKYIQKINIYYQNLKDKDIVIQSVDVHLTSDGKHRFRLPIPNDQLHLKGYETRHIMIYDTAAVSLTTPKGETYYYHRSYFDISDDLYLPPPMIDLIRKPRKCTIATFGGQFTKKTILKTKDGNEDFYLYTHIDTQEVHSLAKFAYLKSADELVANNTIEEYPPNFDD